MAFTIKIILLARKIYFSLNSSFKNEYDIKYNKAYLSSFKMEKFLLSKGIIHKNLIMGNKIILFYSVVVLLQVFLIYF